MESGNKAVFLDRDGTINVEKRYLYKIEDFEYLDGVKEGLKMLQDAGYLLIVVTNQSGIARGYYREADYRKLDKWMRADLRESGIYIADSYYCPHHPEAKIEVYRKECNCRKPKTGLFMQAAWEHNINIKRSYAIGDKRRDLSLCGGIDRIGLHGYLLYSEERDEGSIHCIKGGVLEAAGYIVNHKNGTVHSDGY